MRIPYVLALLPALAGVALGAFAYLSPDTGVDGTAGALLALAGATAVALGALLALLPAVRGWVRKLLIALVGLGAALTAVAAYFLMQDAFAVAMALVVVGLLLAAAFPTQRRPA